MVHNEACWWETRGAHLGRKNVSSLSVFWVPAQEEDCRELAWGCVASAGWPDWEIYIISNY